MATNTYTIQCNQVGLKINLNQPPNGISFLGSTCYLLIVDTLGVEVSYPVQIDASNLFVYYVTQTGQEFPLPGTYSIQLKYTKGSEVYYSNVSTIKAIANI